MTRQPYYDRYKKAGRCVNCAAPTDWLTKCWRCMLSNTGSIERQREQKQAELDRVLAELAATDAEIERLEGMHE